jgi:hypothetical protein
LLYNKPLRGAAITSKLSSGLTSGRNLSVTVSLNSTNCP